MAFCHSYWKITLVWVPFCSKQAIGGLRFRGLRFVSSCWGMTVCSVLCCVKLLGNCNSQGQSQLQAIAGLQFRGSCSVSSYWGIPLCKGVACFDYLYSGTTLFSDALDGFRVIFLCCSEENVRCRRFSCGTTRVVVVVVVVAVAAAVAVFLVVDWWRRWRWRWWRRWWWWWSWWCWCWWCWCGGAGGGGAGGGGGGGVVE